jgi:predicted transposase/invertase (TIGR01784 family)
MIDHDRLFKELLSNFFLEFLDLFFPQVLGYLEPDSVTFLNLEVFTDVTSGERYETDLLAQVRFRGQDSYFLIHLEHQSSSEANFNRRMFRHFARLHEKYVLPIYPIVIFSYDKPKKAAQSSYQVAFPDFQVLEFNYRTIQLNRLNWRDFLNQQNPVASALMAKMKIDPKDRPKVKAQCLRLLVTLKLNPAKTQLISGFIDTYLNLTTAETQTFQTELGTFGEQQEEVMQIVTSWMKEGLQQGIEREKGLVVRMLKRKLDELDAELEAQVRSLEIEQIEALGEALLDFTRVDDLRLWLSDRQN